MIHSFLSNQLLDFDIYTGVYWSAVYSCLHIYCTVLINNLRYWQIRYGRDYPYPVLTKWLLSKVNVAKCTSGVKESSKEIQAIQRCCNCFFLYQGLVAAASTLVQVEEGSIRTSSAEEISNCELKMKQYNTFICPKYKRG